MRKTPITNSDYSAAAKWLAPALLTTGLFTASMSTAHPSQAVLMATAKPTAEPALYTKTVDANAITKPVLVRNTTAKADPRNATTTTTSSTAPKNTDKKAISRCWSRLMNMVREVREAHHKKSK